MKKYTVKENEDLGAVARKFGLPSWKYLYELNKEIIGDNPDMLSPGIKLSIPLWDSTSGDEKINDKGADAFQYVNGMRYRYPWAPFSMSIAAPELDKLADNIPENTPCQISDRKTGTVLMDTTISGADELKALVPDSRNINIGIKGVPLAISGVLHIHPDDNKWVENA